MAAITVTPANVKQGSGARVKPGVSGEVILAGQSVCRNADDSNNIYLADCDDSVNTFRNTCIGVAVNSAPGVGQTINYEDDDTIDFGAGVLEQGMIYVAGKTQGSIQPFSDFLVATVSNKALASNVATLTTSAAHGFAVGDRVTVAGVDSTFNGTFTVTVVGSSTTFSYAKVSSNVSSTGASGTAVIAAWLCILGIAQDTRYLQMLVSAVGINRGV